MNIRFRLPFSSGHASSLTTPLRLLLATTAAFWMGAAQPQVNSAKASRSVTELRFRDFFSMPVGPGGLDISDTLRRADGNTVRLVGYMVQQENPVPGRFMLTPRPVQISEHADGDADDLPPANLVVLLDPSERDWLVPHVRGLVAVSGTLSVRREEAQNGRVSWVRLQMEPESARSLDPNEMAGFLHQRQQNH